MGIAFCVSMQTVMPFCIYEYMEHKRSHSKKKDMIILLIIATISILVLAVILFVNRNNYSNEPPSLSSVLKTFLISMTPIIELRGAIPIAVGSYNMSLAFAFIFSYIGNCIIIPPVILLTRIVLEWLKKHVSFLRKIVERYENRIRRKGEKALKYAELGLLLFVAIPFPGTGAWTGAMIAGLLGIRLRTATPIIAVGVLIAGILILTITNVSLLVGAA